MASTVASPHPMSVMRYLKTAYRAFMASGLAVSFGLVTPPTQAAAAAMTVTGGVLVPDGFPLPKTVSVAMVQASVTKGTQVGAVNQATGAWTVTFPANTAVAGTVTLTATTVAPDPVGSQTSGNITLT